MRVVLAARSKEDLAAVERNIRENGGEAVSIVCDVANEADIKRAIDFSIDNYGKLDFVFSNAGWEGLCNVEFHKTASEDVTKLFNINVLAAIHLIKYAVPVFQRNGGGTFAFNSSLAGALGADIGRNPTGLHLYAVTKAALNQLVRMMAFYEKDNIRTFGILPAVFSTAMVDHIVKGEGCKAMSIASESAFAGFNPRFKGQAGNPAHVAALVLSLIDGTTQYKSGDCIVIDNDVTWNAHEFYARLCLPYEPTEPGNAKDVLGRPLTA